MEKRRCYNSAFLILTVGFLHNMGLCLNIFRIGHQRLREKYLTAKGVSSPKKFGNRCLKWMCVLVTILSVCDSF